MLGLPPSSPQFSLNKHTRWALDALIENGFLYDSSIFPCNIPFYGNNDGPIAPYYPCLEDPVSKGEQRKIIEFPILVFPFFKRKVPMAGGFWLRVFGPKVVSKAIKRMNPVTWQRYTSITGSCYLQEFRQNIRSSTTETSGYRPQRNLSIFSEATNSLQYRITWKPVNAKMAIIKPMMNDSCLGKNLKQNVFQPLKWFH